MSAEMRIEIENLKCGGCARSISNGLGGLAGVERVEVDLDGQAVKVSAPAALRAQIVDKLRALGYPEKGSVEGLSAGLAAAKSFVSCAIGRVS